MANGIDTNVVAILKGTRGQPDNLTHKGNGVLVRKGSFLFLLTARHVVKKIFPDEKIYQDEDKLIRNMNEKCVYHHSTSDGPAKISLNFDKVFLGSGVDITIFRIDPTFSISLEKYGLHVISQNSILQENRFYIHGFEDASILNNMRFEPIEFNFAENHTDYTRINYSSNMLSYGYSGSSVLYNKQVFGILEVIESAGERLLPIARLVNYKQILAHLKLFTGEDDEFPIQIPVEIKIQDAEKIRNKVAKKIAAILDSKKLEPLKKIIIKQNDIDNIPKLFVEGDLLKVITDLDIAVHNTFDELEEESNADIQKKKIWDGAVNIIGWLVLLSVDYNKKEYLFNSIEKMKLEVPVETESGLEIFFSACIEDQARLDVDKPGKASYGKERIKCSDFQGWEEEDHVSDIKKLIWKTIFDEKPPSEFDISKNEHLDETLAARGQKGEHNYLLIDGPSVKAFTKEVYERLNNDLPNLNMICMSVNEKDSVFILSESRLAARLRDFFRNKGRLE